MRKILILVMWLSIISVMVGFSWFLITCTEIGFNAETFGTGGLIMICWIMALMMIYGLTLFINETLFEVDEDGN